MHVSSVRWTHVRWELRLSLIENRLDVSSRMLLQKKVHAIHSTWDHRTIQTLLVACLLAPSWNTLGHSTMKLDGIFWLFHDPIGSDEFLIIVRFRLPIGTILIRNNLFPSTFVFSGNSFILAWKVIGQMTASGITWCSRKLFRWREKVEILQKLTVKWITRLI